MGSNNNSYFLTLPKCYQPESTYRAPFVAKLLPYFFYQDLKRQHRECELYKPLPTSLSSPPLVFQPRQIYMLYTSGLFHQDTK